MVSWIWLIIHGQLIKKLLRQVLRVFTDDNGVFAFVPSRSGQWVIRAVASMDKQNKVVHDASLVVQFE